MKVVSTPLKNRLSIVFLNVNYLMCLVGETRSMPYKEFWRPWDSIYISDVIKCKEGQVVPMWFS